MPEIKKVLFTTDFSEVANHALPYAIKMAKIHKAELIMLHAITLFEHDPNDPEHQFPSLKKYCEEARAVAIGMFKDGEKRAEGAGVPVRKEVIQGVSPHAAILEFVEDEGEIGMIVISTHGRSGLSHVLLGSVAENIIRYSTCPVLVVKQHEHEFIDPDTGDVQIRKILFPVDFSKKSYKPAEYVKSMALVNHAEIIVYHAIDVEIPPVYYTSGVTSILQLDPDLEERVTAKMKEDLGGKLEGFDVSYRVSEGRAGDSIRELAKKEKVDLIIMGTAGSHGIGDFLFGSTSAKVIQKGICPVLVV